MTSPWITRSRPRFRSLPTRKCGSISASATPDCVRDDHGSPPLRGGGFSFPPRSGGLLSGTSAMPDSPPGAVIWDVDGTLVDTAEMHFRAWLTLAGALNKPFTRADFAGTFGWRNPEIIP